MPGGQPAAVAEAMGAGHAAEQSVQGLGSCVCAEHWWGSSWGVAAAKVPAGRHQCIIYRQGCESQS